MPPYVHLLPGRLRVRTAALRSPAAAERARAAIASLAGVQRATANPHTGSLTVNYDRARLGPAAVWARLHRLGVVPKTMPRESAVEVGQIAGDLSRQVLLNLGADLISRAVFGLLF